MLPERVQEALGQLLGAAKEGLLALSVEVGLGVLRELLEAEVEEIVGPKGRHDPERVAVRHGHENGEVTLGSRGVSVGRPRVRSADGESEVALQTYEHFADRDLLGRVARFEPGSDVAERLFIVRSGTVEVIDGGLPEGHVRVVRCRGILGGLALLPEGARSTTERARPDVELLDLGCSIGVRSLQPSAGVVSGSSSWPM